MKNIDINDYLIGINGNLRHAMKSLDESNRKILFVIDENKKLLGTLTDGDIRRWIIKGKTLDDPVEKVCNKKPIIFIDDYSLEDIKVTMLENRIQAIPIVNLDNKIIKILFWDDVFDSDYNFEIKGDLDIPVVIMAGGAGERLAPFTKILPKPLIPVGDKTVIEAVIEKFREFKINDFYISIFHKGKMIKAYFDEINPPYVISYLEEDKPLGTAGVLSNLKNEIEKHSIFLTNCDTIINCNYERLYDFHKDNDYEITLVGSLVNHRVPYGICEIENEGKLISLKEKPEYSYLVSTGMYVLKSSILDIIPDGQFFNMTDLIDQVRGEGKSVGVYPISEKSWLDTGEWKEYKDTIEQLNL